jgi:hypothetical protein
MARRQLKLKPLDAMDVLKREAEQQLERLEAAETLGLLAARDWWHYVREVDPEEARYALDSDGDICH